MLATAWPPIFTAPASTQHAYLPPRPSPLSPRSANACPRPQFWTRHNNSFSMASSSRSASGSENEGIPFAKRDIKSNPVAKRARQTPDEARERRRDMFMKKVERGREDKVWKGRSEQILRSDYLAQRRKWEQERDREAQFFFEDEAEADNEDNALPQSWPVTPRLQAQPDDEQQVDEMAQIEEEELRALLEMQQQQEAEAAWRATQQQDVPSSPTRYGSDDEDYDDIFMELLSSQQQAQASQGMSGQQQDTEMMDTT